MKTITLRSLEDTVSLAKELASLATPNKFFLLSGDLGAGKTTFTKALLKAMGVEEVVSSPTFVIMNQYEANGLLINHLDGYRLTKNDDLEMFVEQFDDAFNIIEWYENFNFNFDEVDFVKLMFVKVDETTREVSILEKEV